MTEKLIEPRRRSISKNVVEAIDLMIGGKAKNITEAAEQVGIARETLSRNLSRPDVGKTMRQKFLKSLAMAAGRASSFVLGLAGIQPATQPKAEKDVYGPGRPAAGRQARFVDPGGDRRRERNIDAHGTRYRQGLFGSKSAEGTSESQKAQFGNG